MKSDVNALVALVLLSIAALGGSWLLLSTDRGTPTMPAQSAGVTFSIPPHPTTTPSKEPTAPKKSSTLVNPKPTSTKTTISARTATPTISASSSFQVVRIQNPYTSGQLTPETLNVRARAALVNILCMPRSGGSLSPISGSGVIIDSRGIILTNAHVAQYVLLSEIPEVDLACTIRTGAPATAQWNARVLYISPAWVNKHAHQVNEGHPLGSGEDDFALLTITNSITSTPLPKTFSYLPVDTRPHIAFLDDPVLVATYPAEFVGGLVAQQNLYPASSFSTVQQFYTFSTGSVDLFSVGGVIEAQGGSSGGAVANLWGYLVGIISTTSEGTTTAARELRALSTDYINRALIIESGKGIDSALQNNTEDELRQFEQTLLPSLSKTYLTLLKR